MKPNQASELAKLITEIVEAPGAWFEKKKEILKSLDPVNAGEFFSWFEGEEFDDSNPDDEDESPHPSDEDFDEE